MNLSVLSPLTEASSASAWRALFLFSGYRLFVAFTLLLVFLLDLPPTFLGHSHPILFVLSSVSYTLMALILFVCTQRQWGGVSNHIKVHLIVDIVMLTLLIHASNGLQSGMGSLILVVVVAGATLVPGKMAAMIAAIATFAVLLEASYSQITGLGETKYSQAGFLGAAFFITAWLAHWLTHKVQTSEVLAAQRAKDVEKLASLNQHIISRLQLGVMVLDAYGTVTLFNDSAKHMLGISATKPGFTLKYSVPVLAAQIWEWQHHNMDAFSPFQVRPDLPELRATANLLDSGETLIYLENTSAMAQQAQQLKLASLGRLTASIAHEIRNPLGAISHAGELIAEQVGDDSPMHKLTDIIQRHSLRMNSIIETILQMSRRKSVEPTVVVLASWLERFVSEFIELKGAQVGEIEFVSEAPFARVAIDPEQLHQVMWNLMDNAWSFANRKAALPMIQIHLNQNDSEIMVDVQDNGHGVPEKDEDNLFEPFHSGRQGGTGLGLYLARELCQANGARLSFLPDECQRSLFRISFATGWQESLA
jgi:two-component system sensor histidine kinase PilS (NtrC family)